MKETTFLESLDYMGAEPQARLRFRGSDRNKTGCGGVVSALLILLVGVTSAAILYQFLSSPSYTQSSRESFPETSNSRVPFTITGTNSLLAARLTSMNQGNPDFNITMYVTPIFFITQQNGTTYHRAVSCMEKYAG